MKSTKRALRRHHRQRMIRRVMRIWGVQWVDEDEEARRLRALRLYNNMSKCSCWICGNPRRYEGRPTLQEKRQLLAALEDEML